MFFHMIKRLVWLVVACASVAIGLKAAGVDVEGLLRLQQFDMQLRSVVGFCGAASLAMLIVGRMMGAGCGCSK